MHNIDDCLFRTSFSISIQGDADLTDFETRMETSFNQFAKAFCTKLNSKFPKPWTLSKRNETRRQDPGHSEIFNIIISILNDKGLDAKLATSEADDM